MTSFNFCLLMIVCDEAPVIRRCLESVLNIMDCYYICDTGSTDGTPEIIKRYLDSAGKRGEIIHKTWVNFGFNKTLLLREFAASPFAGSEYIFWLDADEVFIKDPNDPMSYLSPTDAISLYYHLNSKSESIFLFPTLYGGTQYNRWQFARNDQEYTWKYPVHEVFIGARDSSSYHSTALFNLARKEGNSARNPDRYRDDARMFEKYLEEEPDDSRCVFYLAQTYESFDRDAAIQTYKRRLTLGGYFDEKYIACLRLGYLVADEGERNMYLWRASEIHPQRLETLERLIQNYLRGGEYKRAAAIGYMASESRDFSSFLFAVTSVYHYSFDLEFSIALYRAGDYHRALEIGTRLVSSPTTPEAILPTCRENLKWYREAVNKVGPERTLEYKARLLVIDDFLPDPDERRTFALSQSFNVQGNYPGGRTKSFATPLDKDLFERLLGRRINYFPGEYNGSYQVTFAHNISWIHRDSTDYSAILFLTPNAPANSGTIIYRHRASGLERSPANVPTPPEFHRDAYKEEEWEVVDVIGNKYNRLILFQGRYHHKSNVYFGDSLDTGRLFQIFFFNVD